MLAARPMLATVASAIATERFNMGGTPRLSVSPSAFWSMRAGRRFMPSYAIVARLRCAHDAKKTSPAAENDSLSRYHYVRLRNSMKSCNRKRGQEHSGPRFVDLTGGR